MVGLGITWSSQTSQTSPHGQIQKASLSKNCQRLWDRNGGLSKRSFRPKIWKVCHSFKKKLFWWKWSMHVRNDLKLPTNNNQTNILCESSFRVLKDILFQRIPISSQIMLVCVLVMGVSQMQCITVQQLRSQSAHTDKWQDQVVFICDKMYLLSCWCAPQLLWVCCRLLQGELQAQNCCNEIF